MNRKHDHSPPLPGVTFDPGIVLVSHTRLPSSAKRVFIEVLAFATHDQAASFWNATQMSNSAYLLGQMPMPPTVLN